MMSRKVRFGVALMLCLWQPAAQSQEPATEPAVAAVEDARQLVTLPAEARRLMREDMLDHMVVLNEIIGHMANDQWSAAAEVAETRLGRGSMGRHRATGMGPGRFMPTEMRLIGMSMHDAASEFARLAQQGERQQAQQALQRVMTACVACHSAYRTR